jgi:phage terminase large subunit-like protein
MDLTNKTDEELREIAAALKALSDKNKYSKIKTIFPDTGPLRRELYPEALRYMAAGKDHRFRVFFGGNRSGKSFTNAVEIVYHMTGEYPEWWTGKVFRKITTVWIVAESGALWRDSMQRLLFGEAGDETGTGLLPLAKNNNGIGIIPDGWYSMAGTPGAIGSCVVKNKKGFFVNLVVKTNEMQREQFQAAKVDIVLFDEEPREDIYEEALMRLMSTGRDKEPGIAMLAFTPLKGLSNVILKFLPNGQIPKPGQVMDNKDQYICCVEQDSVPHLSKEDIEQMAAQTSEHLRDARRKGIPTLGSGRIYPILEKDVVVQPFQIPPYWPKAFGLDFGWNCTAAVWGAKDPSTGILYLYSEYYQGEKIPEMHAIAIKAKGAWIQGLCDPSGGGRNSDGTLVIEQYRAAGVELTPADNSVIAGISRNLSLLESGQIKIFSTLTNFLQEFRVYRYDTHNPNKPADKQNDHLMDAWKYLTTLFDWIARSEADQDYQSNSSKKPKSKNVDPLTGY